MNLPKTYLESFAKKFTPEEVKIIDENWNRFSQISLSNSTGRQLNNEAKMVLECSRLYPK